MMKRILLLLLLASAFCASAAQVSWKATGFKNSGVEGVAYLVGSTRAIDLSTIKDTLRTGGIPASYDTSKYTAWGSANEYSTTGGTLEKPSESVTLDIADPDAGLGVYFFVAYVEGDQISISTRKYKLFTTNDPTTINAFSSAFISDGDWYATTPGGGDVPGVPEPTVLALLALGVAGLALRRKIA